MRCLARVQRIFVARLLIAMMRRMLDVGVPRKKSAGAGDGEALVVKQALNFEDGFDVFTAVEAVAAGALHWLQCGKFGFPVAQDEGLSRGETANFADAKKRFFREGGSVLRFRSWSSASHVYLYRRPILRGVNP